MWESSHKTVGIEETGYMAPERKNMGMTRKFMMMLNPSKEVSLAAIKIPREVIQNETRIDAAKTAMNCMSEIWMPRKGVRIMMITAWATDIKVPEIALPKTIDIRDIGATSISFMNPNSRSQTMEMDEKIDEKESSCRSYPGI